MTRQAVAYLRKSRSDDPSKEVSEDVQRSEIERLATRDGVTIVHWFKDWDRSADESKVARRTEYAAMLKMVEACEVEAIYAYAVDRLYRSMSGFMKLTGAAKRCGARIITARDGVVGGDGSPMASAFAQIGAVFTELELNVAKSRARAAYAARVARGDHVGHVPYGHLLVKVDGVNRLEADPERPVEPILDAYQRAGGKVRTAVRILNDDLKLPAPRGGEWDRRTLLGLIQREAPELLPALTASGRRDAPVTPARFAKLLRCHCGRLLTPNRHIERRRSVETVAVSYYCSRGNAMPGTHGRPYYVSEALVQPFIAEQAARYMPDAVITLRDVDAPKRAALEARRLRVLDAYEVGGFDASELRRRVAAIDVELAKLGAQDDALARITIPSAIDWDAEPGEINSALRAIFTAIDLDRDLRPVGVEWSVAPQFYDPEVRAEVEAAIEAIA